MLTQESLKSILHYDPETGVFTRLKSRCKNRLGPAGYKGRQYTQIEVGEKNYRAHRLAWLYVYGEWPTDQIDHINGDGHDNRLVNLRAVTNAENAKNFPLLPTNKSGIMGVRWSPQKSRWYAVITINGADKSLYCGVDFFEACCAKKSAEVLHGFSPNHGRPLRESLRSRALSPNHAPPTQAMKEENNGR